MVLRQDFIFLHINELHCLYSMFWLKKNNLIISVYGKKSFLSTESDRVYISPTLYLFRYKHSLETQQHLKNVLSQKPDFD